VAHAPAERQGDARKTPMSDTTLGPTAVKIISTAKRLFMQRGYRAVSVNDIVQAAEITKPTLYYHFADKEELFVQMSLHMLADMHAQLDLALEGLGATAERLRALAEVMTTATDGDTRMMRHEMREHLSPAQRDRIAHAFLGHIFEPVARVMEQGLAAGDLAGRSPFELAWMFLGLVEGFHQEPESPETAFTAAHFSTETLIDMFLYGVAPRSHR
jgi:AcrR family transcriptional regulator